MRLVCVAGCVLAACSFTPGALPAGTSDAPGAPDDARDPDAAVPDALVLGPFDEATVVTLPGTTTTDDDPSPTEDLLELVFNSSRNSNADVFVSVRTSTSQAWPSPVPITQVSSVSNETTPEVSYDGLTMILASDRVGTVGGNDLYLATRASRTAPWGAPARISELSTTSSEAAGNMTPDGLFIVFTSAINGGESPDLFYAERASTTAVWGTPVEIVSANTTGHEGSPCVTPDKLTIYFDTDRAGTLDIYTTTRASTSDAFSTPVPVSEINTPSQEQDPWISRNGRHLMFSSNRGGTNQLWEARR